MASSSSTSGSSARYLPVEFFGDKRPREDDKENLPPSKRRRASSSSSAVAAVPLLPWELVMAILLQLSVFDAWRAVCTVPFLYPLRRSRFFAQELWFRVLHSVVGLAPGYAATGVGFYSAFILNGSSPATLRDRNVRAEHGCFLIDAALAEPIPANAEDDTKTRSIGRVQLGPSAMSGTTRRVGIDDFALDKIAWVYSLTPDAPDVAAPLDTYQPVRKSDYGHFNVHCIADSDTETPDMFRSAIVIRNGRVFRARVQSESTEPGAPFGLQIVRPPRIEGRGSSAVRIPLTPGRYFGAQVTYNRSGFTRKCRCLHPRDELLTPCGNACGPRMHLDAWIYNVARFLAAQFECYATLARNHPSMDLCAFRPGKEHILYRVSGMNFQRPLSPGGTDTPLNLLPHGLAFKPTGPGWSFDPVGDGVLEPGDRAYNAAMLHSTFQFRVPPPNWNPSSEEVDAMVHNIMHECTEELADIFIEGELDAMCSMYADGE